MTMIRSYLRKKLIGPRKYYWFCTFFIRKERNGKNELKEARKILNNVSFGSSFNSLRASPNVELFVRRAKFSEVSSWKVRHLPKLTSSEWVWIIQHLLSALHWKTSPVKSGVFIRFARENEVSKAIAVFRLLWNLQRAAIVTLSRENTERKGIGWHCFKCWNVFVIATEKKIFMQQEAFFSCSLN